MAKTIVITGTTGFIGSYLVDYFSGQGWHVRALARKPLAMKNKNVTFFSYALGQPIPDKAFAGADYVIHAAYSPQTRGQTDALALNIKGAEQLLAASRKHAVKKNIFISSMSARSDAQAVYGKQKYAIEQLFATKRDANARLGLVIGNGGLVERMITFMKTTHLVPLIGGGEQPLQIIAIADLAKALQAIITKDIDGVVTIANPKSYSYKAVYKAFARSAGIRVRFLPVPYSLLGAGISTSQFLRLPLGFTKDNLLGLKQASAVNNVKDITKLGLKPLSLDEALQARK